MVSMGILKGCPAVSTYRGGFRIKVRVNYRSTLTIVTGASSVTRRDVNVLVRRHKKRNQQSKTHRRHGDTTHGL
jgi:hypothetical protein